MLGICRRAERAASPPGSWPNLTRRPYFAPTPPHGGTTLDDDDDPGSYMTSLLARLGQFDSRRAAQTIWTSGKRKRRSEWTCAACKAKGALRQRRGYSDDSARLSDESFLFNPLANEEQETASKHESNDRNGVVRANASRDSWRYNATMPNAFFNHSDPTQDGPAAAISTLREESSESSEQEQLWERSEQVGDEALDTLTTHDVVRDLRNGAERSIRPTSMLVLDYKEELPTALIRGEADMVVRCLHAAKIADDLEFLRSIPTTTFSEIIRLLEPKNHISKLANAHHGVSPAMAALFGVASMTEVAYQYVSVLRQTIAMRLSDAKLTLADYIVLLRSARDLGNHHMGTEIWASLHHDGHVPNTDCYNYYMATVIWTGVHNAGSRHKFRVTPYNLKSRSQSLPTGRFKSYRVGEGGLRQVAYKIFNDMLLDGAIANEESFRMLVLACAREGDITMVKTLLKKVWKIDVQAILDGQDETEIAPIQYPEHSPLRPTFDLLFSIAHAFGINNDMPAALRTVDFVARHYDLKITNEVWNHLFQTTFVLTVRRLGWRNQTDGNKTGQLPASSLVSLWDTMTGEPYCIPPTISMYNALIKNLFDRYDTAKIIQMMDDGRALYTKHVEEKFAAQNRLWTNVHDRDAGREHESIEELRNQWDRAELICRRDMFWLKRWVRLLLGTTGHSSRVDHPHQPVIHDLPRLLWEWRHFAPTSVWYEMRTGYVSFEIRDHEDMLLNAEQYAKRRAVHDDLRGRSARYIGNSWIQGRWKNPPKRLVEAYDSEQQTGPEEPTRPPPIRSGKE